VLLAWPGRAAAQEAMGAPATAIHVGAQAVPAWFHADPVPGGGSLDEVKLVQPAVEAHASLWGGRVELVGTLDLEGATMPGGELAPGDWGEGFVDRRHPHTYAHELLATANDLLGRRSAAGALSVTVGKGFAPFGTDDPMVRPILRYPVNHHLAQILERAVAIAGWRKGPVGLEAGVFDGDEPTGPGAWPDVGRFGDSWSARATVRPLAGIELQGSFAHVASPEVRNGSGTEQRKVSVSGRLDRTLDGHPVYALAEWARSREAGGAFTFTSALVEASVRAGPHRLAYRFERTSRPEEERSADLFRSIRPPLDNSILGTTRWTLHTVNYTVALPSAVRWVDAAPFVEATFGRVARLSGALFDPVALYGTTRVRAVTVGVRLTFGGGHGHRMGRYGAAGEPMAAHGRMDMHSHEEEK
jgi:hypothetical protein